MVAAAHPELVPILHTLRLIGVVEAGRLVTATGLPEAELRRGLAELASAGLVERIGEGVFTGWRLTPPGIRRDDATLAGELAASGARAGVEEGYRRFLTLNPELLDACTAWQLVTGPGSAPMLNEHTDEAYDAAVVARLSDLHRRAVPLVDDLARHLPRFGRYRHRLEAALTRVEAGEAAWFTGALFDSYHQVWFELHQDLLVTLGRERSSEGAGGSGG